ncbi:hypothetical protein FRY74_00680 [Vicingus serpentipes]|uniref:Uncharacterized protein n=1 Tax=Vicingus serpentipes TaxID=1926625 RepID=A0A5C6RWQ8_9FLAO|nr:hypothetical protein [Vicingus serpentipes]TXB66731.1 hypothetical protein FRY74_00680 [Vicingus serpentipes]
MRIASQISSIIVALLFIYTINFKSIITINYLINISEITELFCVNKEKPQLQCNGKCHLAKQFIETEKDENQSPFSNTQLAYNFDVISILLNPFYNTTLPEKEIKSSFHINSTKTLEHFYSVPSPPPKA